MCVTNGFLSISSKDNPLIRLTGALQMSAKERRKNGLFVLEGLRICSDAFENGICFEKLIVSEGAYLRYGDTIAGFADHAEQCVRIPDGLFNKISDTDSPQGVIALVKLPGQCSKPRPDGRYIGLENIADPSNLGAVSRTAEALGVSGILLTNGSCDPYSPKSLRASMGTLLRVPLFLVNSLCDTAHDSGLRTFACVVDREVEPVTNITFCDGDLLMIGNEANGLTHETKTGAFQRITIPMRGRAESMNAAAAAAVVMWEMMRGTLK